VKSNGGFVFLSADQHAYQYTGRNGGIVTPVQAAVSVMPVMVMPVRTVVAAVVDRLVTDMMYDTVGTVRRYGIIGGRKCHAGHGKKSCNDHADNQFLGHNNTSCIILPVFIIQTDCSKSLIKYKRVHQMLRITGLHVIMEKALIHKTKEEFVMLVNKNEITNEMLEKVAQCKTADELVAYAKSEGVELTKDEAEAYLAEIDDIELDDATLKQVTGGYCVTDGFDTDCLEKGMFHP
jgi:hypothetical protein